MTCGFFAVGIWHPKHENNVGTLWRSATLYDAAFVFTVGARYRRQASDTPNTPAHIPLFHYTDVDDLVKHLPYSAPLVGIELDSRAKDLTSYSHPQRAVYLLGAEDHGLSPEVMDRCHDLVVVPTVRSFSHNVAVAGGILLHDRFTKSQKVAA